MSNRDIYQKVSNDILELDFNSSPHLNIYKENFLAGAIEKLEEAYPGTYLYMGKNNFHYFVRFYLKEDAITSSNIDHFIENFTNFLIHKQDFHKDELITLLAQIDFMWNSGKYYKNRNTYPVGLMQYWFGLLNEQGSLPTIDTSEEQTVEISEVEGERSFSIKS